VSHLGLWTAGAPAPAFPCRYAENGSPAAALQSSCTPARLGVELRDSPRKSWHESPRRPRRKPARESSRETPGNRLSESPRQTFYKSAGMSASELPSNSTREPQAETPRISRSDSRRRSRPQPQSEPPREPFRERFTRRLAKCRFRLSSARKALCRKHLGQRTVRTGSVPVL
jgi:hypothetical protein